jgi:addiction module HigA family antidote
MSYRLANPAHPGAILKTEVIEPLGLTISEAARILDVTRPALSSLLNQRSSLSPEMALRIEKAFGISMDTMMRIQLSHDLAALRKREGEIKVARYKPPRQPKAA